MYKLPYAKMEPIFPLQLHSYYSWLVKQIPRFENIIDEGTVSYPCKRKETYNLTKTYNTKI